MTSSVSQVKPRRDVEKIFLLAVLAIPLGISALCLGSLLSIKWSESKGPFQNMTSVADLDSDGDLDVILGQIRWEAEEIPWSSLSLWYNQGGGRFVPDDQDLPSGFSAAAADLDGDGDADLLVLDRFRITYLFNQGGAQGGAPGAFKTKDSPITPPGAGPGMRDMGGLVLAGDLDAYLAVSTRKPGSSRGLGDRVLLNDGAGNLRDSGQRLGITGSSSVALGDLDGDADLDALVGTLDAAEAWINQGGAQGGQAGIYASTGQAMWGNQVRSDFLSDLDADGDRDSLIGRVKQAAIWWNDGQGMFTRSDQRLNYTQRHGLAVADFDGDALPDIFAGAYTEDYRIWLNQGDGTFRATDSP